MRITTTIAAGACIALAFALAGCESSTPTEEAPAESGEKTDAMKEKQEGTTEQGSATGAQGSAGESGAAKASGTADSSAHAASLRDRIEGEYREWGAGHESAKEGASPHGAWIRTSANATAAESFGGSGAWPAGSVFAMDEFAANDTGDGPGDLVAINVMEKRDDAWFWAKYGPDGALLSHPADHETMGDRPIAGTEGLACITCHRQSESRDHVIAQWTAEDAGATQP